MVGRDLRQHVLEFGHNATAYQTLNGGFAHAWFGECLVGFVRARAWPGGPPVWVAAGAPLGPASAQAEAVSAFDALAKDAGGRAIWFGVEPGEVPLFRGHTGLVVGSHPVWDPRDWSGIVESHASVRSQIQRAANKGVEIEEMPPEIASSSAPLHQCLREWMASRGLPPLRFLTDPFVLDRLGDRRVFVAHQGDSIVAYAVILPVPDRAGWMVEWIIRGRDAPNGTPSRLLDAIFDTIADEGARWATLGLAALSSTAPASSTPPPVLVRATLSWTRAHARRFYNFEGLERFKAKFRPMAWEPIRLYVDTPQVSLSTLYALADAFAGDRSPVGLVSRALAGAVRDEVRFASQAVRRTLSSQQRR